MCVSRSRIHHCHAKHVIAADACEREPSSRAFNSLRSLIANRLIVKIKLLPADDIVLWHVDWQSGPRSLNLQDGVLLAVPITHTAHLLERQRSLGSISHVIENVGDLSN